MNGVHGKGFYMKNTRFAIGIMMIINSVSCMFLVIAYLLKDKKNTASPFMMLGTLYAIIGAVLVADKVKEKFEDDDILEAMDNICGDDYEIPVDDTANEEEFC